jgi:hypothetical protein
VLPEPPAEESLLLALLASSGMPMGQASSVVRKLLEVGITSLDCPQMEPLDEFDLGRIVGTQKGRVVAAFRKAGWAPPKERKSIPAMPTRKSGGLSGAERIWQAANEIDEEESRRMA